LANEVFEKSFNQVSESAKGIIISGYPQTLG
jgi:hypothetical protein